MKQRKWLVVALCVQAFVLITLAVQLQGTAEDCQYQFNPVTTCEGPTTGTCSPKCVDGLAADDDGSACGTNYYIYSNNEVIKKYADPNGNERELSNEDVYCYTRVPCVSTGLYKGYCEGDTGVPDPDSPTYHMLCCEGSIQDQEREDLVSYESEDGDED
jgi:hypothetical protein